MTCEKCWVDAAILSVCIGSNQVDEYDKLLKEREAYPCTPVEQCGTLHIIVKWKDGTEHCICGKET